MAGSMPSGPKHVRSGVNHPSHDADGNFNQGPNDATTDITKHYTGAGTFPGTGATGGATRHSGPENASVIRHSGGKGGLGRDTDGDGDHNVDSDHDGM